MTDSYVVVADQIMISRSGRFFVGKAVDMPSPEDAVRAFIGGKLDLLPCDVPALEIRAFTAKSGKGSIGTFITIQLPS